MVASLYFGLAFPTHCPRQMLKCKYIYLCRGQPLSGPHLMPLKSRFTFLSPAHVPPSCLRINCGNLLLIPGPGHNLNARNYFIFIMLFIYLTSWHCSYFLVAVVVFAIVIAVSGPGNGSVLEPPATSCSARSSFACSIMKVQRCMQQDQIQQRPPSKKSSASSEKLCAQFETCVRCPRLEGFVTLVAGKFIHISYGTIYIHIYMSTYIGKVLHFAPWSGCS